MTQGIPAEVDEACIHRTAYRDPVDAFPAFQSNYKILMVVK
jgi:hypothetical protein